jgi:hypothetical protein
MIFVAIALLIVTVGVLETESRLPNAGQNSASWHTSKVSRVAHCSGDELAPVQINDSRPAPAIVTVEVIHHFFPLEFVLPELASAPQAHGLRAPPHA